MKQRTAPGTWVIKGQLPDLLIGPSGPCYIARLFHPDATIRGTTSLAPIAEHVEQNAEFIVLADHHFDKVVEALRKWQHWYDTDSSEFNRETAYGNALSVLHALDLEKKSEAANDR